MAGIFITTVDDVAAQPYETGDLVTKVQWGEDWR